jgi:hypothetical protein
MGGRGVADRSRGWGKGGCRHRRLPRPSRHRPGGHHRRTRVTLRRMMPDVVDNNGGDWGNLHRYRRNRDLRHHSR